MITILTILKIDTLANTIFDSVLHDRATTKGDATDEFRGGVKS